MKIQPSICLDDWGKPRKKPSQVGRHRDSQLYSEGMCFFLSIVGSKHLSIRNPSWAILSIVRLILLHSKHNYGRWGLSWCIWKCSLRMLSISMWWVITWHETPGLTSHPRSAALQSEICETRDNLALSRTYVCITIANTTCENENSYNGQILNVALIVPRGWEIGCKQSCIKCQKNSATHFVYFWSHKTLHNTDLEATSCIPQQGQSLHIWTTSLSTTGCYKNKYTIQFLSMPCISRSARGNFKRWNWVSAWHYKG